MKVMTIVGTRPEIIRLSRVVPLLATHTDHSLIHTGQNYDFELSDIFFRDLRLAAPKTVLKCAGRTSAETVANVITQVDAVLEDQRPDALLILGDTNSAMAAYPAKRRKIPIFHMEAGNRCFDLNVPEEVNRRLVDQLADVNLPYSERARENLIREGFAPDRLFKTGSPMREVFDFYRDDVERSDVLAKLTLKPREFFVFTAHREENVDRPEHLQRLGEILRQLTAKTRQRVIFSCHPRTRQRLAGLGTLPAGVEVMKPLGFFDFVRLQKEARAVISDSGALIEEAALLGFPAISLRTSFERPEGLEEGAAILGNLSPDAILNAVDVLASHGRPRGVTRVPADYDVADVSDRVLKTILSMTDYVKRNVWGQK